MGSNSYNSKIANFWSDFGVLGLSGERILTPPGGLLRRLTDLKSDHF
jgi:hypothetical protein